MDKVDGAKNYNS